MAFKPLITRQVAQPRLVYQKNPTIPSTISAPPNKGHVGDINLNDIPDNKSNGSPQHNKCNKEKSIKVDDFDGNFFHSKHLK